MEITEIVKIENHVELAKARIIEQDRGKTGLERLYTLMAERYQELEDAFFQLLNERGIEVAVGEQLNVLGELLDQPRNGLDDDNYRIRLYAKIAQNVSKGTPEDLIKIFKLLTGAEHVEYHDFFPAGLYLTAVGVTNPIASGVETLAVLNLSRAGGVSIEYLVTTPEHPFVFLTDPDPNGDGFGVLSDPTEGGYLAALF